jgi:transcriptional regulator with PAS, ATPase and Fis domain
MHLGRTAQFHSAAARTTEHLDLSVVVFVGKSPAFVAARERISRIARTDATVLIEGETGTGKEMAARVLHYEGSRRRGPFIPVNCGAIPDALIESEFFGYRPGAFTDAKTQSPGMLMLAHGGTLFLDEVDSLSPRAQVALLRFLQDRSIRPLGGGAERKVDARVVSASNRNLETLVSQGAFRQDLYYRLNVMYVELPPLRQRVGDVELLAEHYLGALATRSGSPVPMLDAKSCAWMRTHPWPGNIRELENLLEREFLLAEGGPVLRLSTIVKAEMLPATEERFWNYGRAKAHVLEEFERGFLERLMRFARGNVTLAARTAGKERRDLGRLLRKHAILPDTFRLTGCGKS